MFFYLSSKIIDLLECRFTLLKAPSLVPSSHMLAQICNSSSLFQSLRALGMQAVLMVLIHIKKKKILPEYLLNITKYLGVRFTILHFCLLVFYFILRQGFSLWFWLFWDLHICKPGWPASQSAGIKGVQHHCLTSTWILQIFLVICHQNYSIVKGSALSFLEIEFIFYLCLCVCVHNLPLKASIECQILNGATGSCEFLDMGTGKQAQGPAGMVCTLNC